MVRTRGDKSSVRVAVSKTPAAVAKAGRSGTSSGAGSSSQSPVSANSNKYSGGNSYCPRPTPDWQKSIDGFFNPIKSKGSDAHEEDSPQCSSGSSGSSTPVEDTNSE